MVSSIDPALFALAGVGLTDARTVPAAGWEPRLDEVFRHGLAGLLARAQADGLVELDDTATEGLTHRLQAEAIRAVQLEGELIRLEGLLAELDAVVLKGAVLAHAAYPDPALRPFTDLDVLVDGPRHAEAVRALEGMGYARSRPEPVARYDATIGKAHTLIHPGGVVIDLHRTLVAGLTGASIDVPAILADRRTVEVNGRPVPTLSWEAHLIEVCLHAVVGDRLERALSIRDVAQVALTEDLDADRVADLTDRWKVTGVVAEGLGAAVEAIGVEVPSELIPRTAAAHPFESADPVSVRGRLGELRQGSVRGRITLLRSVIAPNRDFLRFTYGEASTPELYGRRWRDLAHRAVQPRSPTAPDRFAAPPDAPSTPADAAEPESLRVRDRPDSPYAVREPVLGPPAVVALQPPGAPRTLNLARTSLARDPVHSAPGAGEDADTSRQARWSGARPARPAANGHAEPPRLPPPPPPPPPPGGGAGSGGPPGTSDEQPDAAPAVPVGSAAVPPRGVAQLWSGVAVLVLTMVASRLGLSWVGLVLVPVAGLLFAWSASCHIARRRPEDAWVGRWLIIATVVKIAASYARYLTLIIGYEGVGDSTDYDLTGRALARGWLGDGPVRHLDDLRQTNFVRWFTGVVYFLFGSNMIAGFFVFGLLALIGSYFWYRATADAVPFIDKRLYLGLVLFAPSIAFWPSSIGKESLMQLGIGATTLGTAFLLRQRLLPGLVFGLAGGWLLWVVRPHLLALVALSAGFAYLIGRVRPSTTDTGSVVVRTLGLVVIAFLVAFAVGQGAEFLGIKDYSLSSVETALDEQSAKNTTSSSSFDNGGSNYLSPVNLPRGAATVLLRPFPWETSSPFQLLASLESVIVAGLIVVRFSSIRTSLARARGTPFLLYAWIMITLYAATFSSFSNFGLLVRQRSLVLPALFVLIAVRPALPRSRDHGATEPTGVHGGAP